MLITLKVASGKRGGMGKQLPLEISKMASSRFAGNSGFSGPEIFEWFGQFSDEIGDYPWQGAGSRWMMFENCLDTFSVTRQCELLLKLIEYQGPMKHGRPAREECDRLRKAILGFQANLINTESTLATIDWTFVRDNWRKTLERTPGDPEGAITAARTTLESVCKHILEESNIEDQSKGDLVRLYKATAKELRLSPGGYAEDIFKQILGGCASIKAGLSGLRNAYGDSHGKGRSYPKPQPRHARLAINAAMTLAEFLIETYKARRDEETAPNTA